MMLDKIHTLQNYLNQLATSILIPSNQIHPFDATKANETISLIAKDIETINPNISQKLIQAKDNLFFYNDFGTINPNPVALGQVLAYVNLLLDSETGKQIDEWNYIHQLIIKSSQKLYIDGNYAEAAVNAFIEINARVKKLYYPLFQLIHLFESRHWKLRASKELREVE